MTGFASSFAVANGVVCVGTGSVGELLVFGTSSTFLSNAFLIIIGVVIAVAIVAIVAVLIFKKRMKLTQ